MMSIRDRDGNVISKSRNLAGIRRYVGGHTPPLIKVLDVSEIGDKEGKLCILFENGCSFETNFASYSVLRALSGDGATFMERHLPSTGNPQVWSQATIPSESTPTKGE